MLASKQIKMTRKSGIDILTIDDHPVFRQGIHHLLEDEDGMNPVAEIGSINEALHWLASNKADIVLLDHNLTDINGVDAIPFLLKAQPSLEIIMLTVSDDSEVFIKAIRNGACGYVLKDSSPDHIIEAIHAAKLGESRVSDSLVRCLFEDISNNVKASNSGQQGGNLLQTNINPSKEVNERQKEILEQLVGGLSNKEIAKVLQISPNTVRNQLQKLQDVFSARNRVQLALLAFDAGIGGIR